ncbi:MAG: aminopeptidase [Candidatus Omnitrophica bacterium]|nr:aminopeptidase [Candidatus Omnitrophota bacterium]
MLKELNKIVDKIVYQCMGYQRGERILIITDDKLVKIAKIFYERIKNLGIEISLMCIPPRSVHGEEPPPEVTFALKATNVALLITSRSLSHTYARQSASKKYGVRIASMPGINLDILKRSLNLDYKELSNKTNRLAVVINRGKNIRVKTKKGTDVNFSIKGRKTLEDNGLYIQKGAFGNLPAGEVCIAPLEGTTQGILLIDASFAMLGRLRKPIELEAKNGIVVKINDTRLKRLLSRMGKSALNIAEFGIGLNPKAIISGNILEDEKATGTAHIALGDNLSFGGRTKAKCHLDGVFLNPEVWVDEEKII